jgi:hypothetical protein
MSAYNAETALTRALDSCYARAGDEAYALIREALTTSGDIIPGHGELLVRLDPLTAPRRTQALAALCYQLNQAQACYPGTDLILRYEVKPHIGIAGNTSLCQESWSPGLLGLAVCSGESGYEVADRPGREDDSGIGVRPYIADAEVAELADRSVLVKCKGALKVLGAAGPR